eukprot:6385493-Pyramimonas_sp.AAC.1
MACAGEMISNLPAQLQVVQLALLMKASGGWRPIGLFCSLLPTAGQVPPQFRVGVGAQQPAEFLCRPGVCSSQRRGLETKFQGGGDCPGSGPGDALVGFIKVQRSDLHSPLRAALRDVWLPRPNFQAGHASVSIGPLRVPSRH